MSLRRHYRTTILFGLSLMSLLFQACAHLPQKPVTQEEVEKVKFSFKEALIEDLYKNKKDRNLKNVDVKNVSVSEKGGKLNVEYRLSYDEYLEDGEIITIEFEADALLERQKNGEQGWAATRMKAKSQTLTFQKGMLVQPEHRIE